MDHGPWINGDFESFAHPHPMQNMNYRLFNVIFFVALPPHPAQRGSAPRLAAPVSGKAGPPSISQATGYPSSVKTAFRMVTPPGANTAVPPLAKDVALPRLGSRQG
jgi:hypothetical protein